MDRQHKVWGERLIVRADSTHETSVLFLTKGTRCSWHAHREKYNRFVVISGKVMILTDHDEVTLGPKEGFTVGPGLSHEFRAYENSVMVEEMFVEYDPGDIEREIVGSRFDLETGRILETHPNGEDD